MSLKTLERAIRAEAQIALKNPKLKHADIREWSTSKEQVEKNMVPATEVYVHLPIIGVHAAILKTADKRKPR